jgi:hypothetical protein
VGLAGVEGSDSVNGEPDIIVSDDRPSQHRAGQLRINGKIIQEWMALVLVV